MTLDCLLKGAYMLLAKSRRVFLIAVFLLSSTLIWGCAISEFTYEERNENFMELKQSGVSYGQVVKKVFPEIFEKYSPEEAQRLEFYRYDTEKDLLKEYMEMYKNNDKKFLEEKEPIEFHLDAYSCPVKLHVFSDIDPNIRFLFQRQYEGQDIYSYEYANEEQFIRIHVSDDPIEDYGQAHTKTLERYDSEITLWSIGNLDNYRISKDSKYYLIKVMGEVPEETLNLVFYRVINFW
jgi:hypothetical protein